VEKMCQLLIINIFAETSFSIEKKRFHQKMRHFLILFPVAACQ